MQGLNKPAELRGVIPLSFDHIFMNIVADPATQFLVRCSFLEVYREGASRARPSGFGVPPVLSACSPCVCARLTGS
jgi:hypothetical protein